MYESRGTTHSTHIPSRIQIKRGRVLFRKRRGCRGRIGRLLVPVQVSTRLGSRGQLRRQFEHEPERILAVQVEAVEALFSYKAQGLIQPQRRAVVELRLEDDLRATNASKARCSARRHVRRASVAPRTCILRTARSTRDRAGGETVRMISRTDARPRPHQCRVSGTRTRRTTSQCIPGSRRSCACSACIQ